MSALPAISRAVEIASISATPSFRRIEFGEQERDAIRQALGLVALPALSAEIELRRDRRGTVHLDGQLSAEIVQECVFSLEPVRQTIDESIGLRFVESRLGAPSLAAVDVAPTGDDPPEIVSGPFLDLGPIVIEHFVLAIDPYPRAPGAEQPENPAASAADSGESPFSVLRPLTGRPKLGSGKC